MGEYQERRGVGGSCIYFSKKPEGFSCTFLWILRSTPFLFTSSRHKNRVSLRQSLWTSSHPYDKCLDQILCTRQPSQTGTVPVSSVVIRFLRLEYFSVFIYPGRRRGGASVFPAFVSVHLSAAGSFSCRLGIRFEVVILEMRRSVVDVGRAIGDFFLRHFVFAGIFFHSEFIAKAARAASRVRNSNDIWRIQ